MNGTDDDRDADRPGAARPEPGTQATVDRLLTMFEKAPVGIGIVDSTGRTTMTNSILRTLLGYSADELAALPFAAYTHPEDEAANAVLFGRMMAGGLDHFALEKRFIRKSGDILWADLTVSLVRDAAGRPDYAIGTTQDITERKRLESELRAAELRYRLLVERVPAVVYIAEPSGRWRYVSPQIDRMLGFTPADWLADPGLWARQLHPRDRAAAQEHKRRTLQAGTEATTTSTTYRLRHRDGGTVWVRDDAMVLRDDEHRATFHGVLVDVTPEKRVEEHLGHRALHDPLTGLPNRELFHARVADALARADGDGDGVGVGVGGSDGRVAVLFIDLDGFKSVNDTHGHACGDAVLTATAQALAASVGPRGTAARLGGDEFALLVEGATDDEVQALARRVQTAIGSTVVRFDGHAVSVEASVGVAVSGPLLASTATLLRHADQAMYQEKLARRGNR